jgi:hypothetical protein
MVQQRDDLRLRDALIERFAWGRSYAGVRSAGFARGRRLGFALATPLLPLLLSARIAALVWRRGGVARIGRFVGALPWVLLLLAAWSAGEAAGYAAGSDAES